MREPPEAVDDPLVGLRPFHQLGVAGGRIERDRQGLVGGILAMLQRHIEKLPFPHRKPHVELPVQRVAQDRACGRIGGERAGVAAKHVARKLIEHDDQRNAAGRRLAPPVERARGGPPVQSGKTRAYRRVERGVPLEPPFQQRLCEPEVEHRARLGRNLCAQRHPSALALARSRGYIAGLPAGV